MKYTVVMLPEAKADLYDVFMYVAQNDSLPQAEKLLSHLEQRCNKLATNPQRGHMAPELKRVHVPGFREIHFKPYRILYQIINTDVYIHAVLDGRRDLQDLLAHRLIR